MERLDVVHLFMSQHGVASVRQLRALGVSMHAIANARQRGTVTNVVTGVVRLAGTQETFESRAMALQLHVSPTSYLSGVSAGVIHGLRGMPRHPIEITTKQQRRKRMPSWGRLEYTSWAEDLRGVQTRPDGLRVADPLLTLFRLARTFNQYRFERAAEDCWHRKLITPEAAADYLAEVRRSGRGGVKRFEHWLQRLDHRRPSQSGLELDVIEAIRRAGLPEPERQLALLLRSGEMIHVDLAWPNVRLGVEPGHSWWHGGDLKQRADQARDRACDEIGWRIVRHDESVRDELAAFGLQLRIIYDERLRSLRTA